MGLDYSKFNNMYGVDYDKRQKQIATYVLSEITKRQARLTQKQEAIASLQYEANLIVTDICRTIQEDLWAQPQYNMFYGFNNELFYEAWRYFNQHKKKDFKPYEDKEVKSKERRSFNFVDDHLRQCIFTDPDDAKMIECLDYCYSIGYDFTYKYKGEIIQIYIPLFQRADGKNYLDMLSGYRLKFKESEYGWGWIAGGLDYRELKTKLDDWLKERAKKQEEQPEWQKVVKKY